MCKSRGKVTDTSLCVCVRVCYVCVCVCTRNERPVASVCFPSTILHFACMRVRVCVCVCVRVCVCVCVCVCETEAAQGSSRPVYEQERLEKVSGLISRSEERRVGRECRSRWSP